MAIVGDNRPELYWTVTATQGLGGVPVLGHLFNVVVRFVGIRDIGDTQCGFKLFRGPVADDLFGALRTDGYAFDVEFLLLAQQRGYRIAEVPVNAADLPGSKIAVLRHGPGMLGEILAARWRLAISSRRRRNR